MKNRREGNGTYLNGGNEERKQRTSELLDLRHCFLFHWGDKNQILVGVQSLRPLVFRAAARIILTVVLLEEKLLYVGAVS